MGKTVVDKSAWIKAWTNIYNIWDKLTVNLQFNVCQALHMKSTLENIIHKLNNSNQATEFVTFGKHIEPKNLRFSLETVSFTSA